MNFREFRNGAMYLIAMADFWKNKDAERKAEILNHPRFRELFFERLAEKAAQDIVWKAGYNFFSGGLHGYNLD